MPATAIIGGGLSGLTLAYRLIQAGQEVQIYEARDRLGGRILTREDGPSGMAVDLGPSWVWPDSQPELVALIEELGLELFPQHDAGVLLHLTDPEQGPSAQGSDPVHGGAHRMAGGLGRLIEALAARIGPERITLNAALTGLEAGPDGLRLDFAPGGDGNGDGDGDGPWQAQAGRVVLAGPPRLWAEHLRFAPALPPDLSATLGACPTWMGREAKAVLLYDRPAWRDEGYSGTAFIAHERAVLAECFDLSGPQGTPGALGGFLALTPEARAEFAGGLPMLLENQLVQLYGAAASGGRLMLQDWAREPWSCAALDRTDPARAERRAGPPLLRRSFWDGRLHFAGSETARRAPGQMAGAVEAGERVAARLLRGPATAPDEALAPWLVAQEPRAFAAYQAALTAQLSTQNSEQVTRMAMIDCLQLLFEEALDQLLLAPPSGPPPEAIADAKPALQRLLGGLLRQVMGFNRNSCALRNFPAEHTLPDSYLRQIQQDASQLATGFLNEMDALLSDDKGDRPWAI